MTMGWRLKKNVQLLKEKSVQRLIVSFLELKFQNVNSHESNGKNLIHWKIRLNYDFVCLTPFCSAPGQDRTSRLVSLEHVWPEVWAQKKFPKSGEWANYQQHREQPMLFYKKILYFEPRVPKGYLYICIFLPSALNGLTDYIYVIKVSQNNSEYLCITWNC
jgi:hypothetical protein